MSADIRITIRVPAAAPVDFPASSGCRTFSITPSSLVPPAASVPAVPNNNLRNGISRTMVMPSKSAATVDAASAKRKRPEYGRSVARRRRSVTLQVNEMLPSHRDCPQHPGRSILLAGGPRPHDTALPVDQASASLATDHAPHPLGVRAALRAQSTDRARDRLGWIELALVDHAGASADAVDPPS